MDEMSGQFYAIYGNTYHKMSTKPMLKEKWGPGELINQLVATRQVFRINTKSTAITTSQQGARYLHITETSTKDCLVPTTLFQPRQTNDTSYHRGVSTGTS